jgi:hypothetical protein
MDVNEYCKKNAHILNVYSCNNVVKKLIEYLDMAWKILTHISTVAMKIPVTPTYNAISFVVCTSECGEAANGKYVPY